jgi:lipopolysaccharide export system permease protein
MIAGTLSRYFALRFVTSVVGSFIGVIALAAMIDYVELMRRGADWPNATAWLLAKISMYRVPQLTERILPFTVLVGAMSCYLTLSRRHELVVARAAGVSAWQFVAPAVVAAFILGTIATTLYNPVSAMLHERSKRLEADMQGATLSALHRSTSGFWVRQKSSDGAAIINAISSREQGAQLGGVSVYTFDNSGHFQERIEAKSATLQEGYWLIEDARIYISGKARIWNRPTVCRPTSRSSRCARVLRRLKPCRSGNYPLTSNLLTGQVCSPPVTGCNISSCSRDRFCSPRWSCSLHP